MEAVSLCTDKAYFEEYFKICAKYQEKRLSLEKLKKPDPKLEVQEVDKLKSRILELNGEIKNEEALFWQDIDKAKKIGSKFAVEDIASQYKLEIFEKRVLLFFLFLEYLEVDKNICTEDELLSIFDTEGSVLSRMRNAKYFIASSALYKNHLLTSDSKRNCEYSKAECMITSKSLDIIAKVLNGEIYEESDAPKQKNYETIGYVKDPEYKFSDVLLGDDIREKVTLFLDAYRDNKFETLGIAQRIKKGLGTAFLFYGPPGTGKSMLAEAVAAYVGKKVLMVEYPKIMDRYVGATDKNIARIFKSAEEEDLVVILDEADTLFYNRSFAFEEHDIRFVNEMLQELEKFKGIIILTTNMDKLLDQALERRLALKIKFENPSKELRVKIWQSHMPDKIKLAEGIDFEMLAKKYDFSGGNIKNAALNAFRKMTSKNTDTLTMEDLVFGADLEKAGMYNSKTKRDIIGFAAQ